MAKQLTKNKGFLINWASREKFSDKFDSFNKTYQLIQIISLLKSNFNLKSNYKNTRNWKCNIFLCIFNKGRSSAD